MTTTSTVARCFQQETDDCRLCITLGDCWVVDLAKVSQSRVSDEVQERSTRIFEDTILNHYRYV